MTIREHLIAQALLAELAPPIIGEAQKEPLIAVEAGHDIRAVLQRFGMVRRKTRGDTTHIGDIFTQGLATIHRQIREGTIGTKLRRQTIPRGLEVRQIVRRPPVAQLTVLVEFRPFIIKAMRDLMPDDGADGAIVLRRIAVGIKKWGLQGGGGEVQRIHRRQIDGIDRLRFHHPLRAIHRFA